MASEDGTLQLGDFLATFKWTLDITLVRDKKPEESIWSPYFTTLTPDNGTNVWRIQLYPNGINRKSKGYMSIYIHSVDCHVLECKTLLVYFSIIDDQKDGHQDVLAEELAKPNSRIRGIDKFIKRKLLSSLPESYGSSIFYNTTNHMDQNVKLTIQCCIKLLADTNFKPIPPPQSMKPKVPCPLPRSKSLDTLHDQSEEKCEDLEESDNSDEFNSSIEMDDFEWLLVHGRSDVTLLVSGKSFHAHKAVLAARSTVFASYFKQDKLDKRRISVIDMGQLDPEIIKKVMRFVYIGQLINLNESAHELLGPANTYALDELKKLCEDTMIKHLNIFNASNYLVLSFYHNASRLLVEATDFFIKNCGDIMKTPGFSNLAGHPDILATLFTKLSVENKLNNVL